MKFTNIKRDMRVKATFVRDKGDTLHLDSCMEGAKAVEDIFFKALEQSLLTANPIPHHLKVATLAANKVAESFGETLSSYGFYGPESRAVIDKIQKELSLIGGEY